MYAASRRTYTRMGMTNGSVDAANCNEAVKWCIKVIHIIFSKLKLISYQIFYWIT